MEIGRFFLIAVVLCDRVESQDCCINGAKEVFQTDYDKFEPPWKKGKPANVYIKMNIIDIDSIYDEAMEFSIQSYLIEYWKDSRLNLSKYKDESAPVFPSYLVTYAWMPDLVFDNTRNGKLFQLSLPNTVIKILKDGTLFRSSRYNLLVGCHMDFKFFPMDTQKCYLKISTMSNPDHKVLLHWVEEFPTGKMKSIELMNDIQPLKYILGNPIPYKSTEVWTLGNYTYLYANFTFVRRLSGTVMNMYLPSTLVVLLSWISFWLDIEAVPARVTLGVTSLLTLSTQVAQAHSRLPDISYLTAMDIWLFTCLIMVFSSLIEFSISYQLYVRRNQQTVNRDSNSVLPRDETAKSKKELHVFRRRQDYYRSSRGVINSPKTLNSPIVNSTQMTSHKNVDVASRILFPLFFLIFAFTYWSYYLCFK